MKTIPSRCTLPILFCLVLPVMQAAAQWRAAPEPPMPSVLNPQPHDFWIGPQAGVNLTTQSGSFTTPVCDCLFSDGSGQGALAGIEAGLFLSRSFAVAVKVTWHDLQAKYSNITTEMTIIKDEPDRVPVDFKRDLTMNLSYISINPVFEYTPFLALYVFGGPAVSMKLNSTFSYTKQPVDKSLVFYSTGGEVISVVEDGGDFPGAKSIRVDLRAGLGYNVRLGHTVVFAPEVSYNHPLTTIAAFDNWKASAIHVAGVLKFFL